MASWLYDRKKVPPNSPTKNPTPLPPPPWAFSWLVRLRRTGDYGGSMHVSLDEAQDAVDKARRILRAVRTTGPEPLPQVEDEL